MTNTDAPHSISWVSETGYYHADSIFDYSVWYIELRPSGDYHLYLTREDYEGTMPDQDYGYFPTVEAAQEHAVEIEGEWL